MKTIKHNKKILVNVDVHKTNWFRKNQDKMKGIS